MSKNFAFVYISPSEGKNKFSNWEDKIKENFGPLSGYNEDLKNGKSLDSILFDILNIKPEESSNIYPNYLNIKGIYLEYIKNLQEDLNNEDINLQKEISCLEAESPSLGVINVLKKYGILGGIEFLIPYEKIYKNYNDFMGENVYKGRKNPYKQYWESIISSENYVSNKEFKYYDIKLSVQVLIFSKVKFKFFDITNFISSVSTTSNIGSGGNFNIQLNLVSLFELENEIPFQDNNINITGYSKALALQSIFRENDLIFIKFENLKAENENINSDKKIKGKYWDLIGLLDGTSITSSYNNISLEITGRDLIKVLIEDYNLFIPIQFGNTPETIFGGGGTKIFNRLFCSGEYNLEFVKSFRSIEDSVGFIFSQLTNIEILSPACIDLLKQEYGEDLSKQFEYVKGEKKEKKEIIRGIWGLINFYVDEKITHYRIADSSLKSPDGSVLEQIQKVCQDPFVEIIADTIVDKYSIFLRKPPFSIKDISEQKFIVVDRNSVISDNLDFNKEIYTIYQLNPQGGCLVNNNSIPLAYLPMIVLDEYTKMWGNKVYSKVFNYINIDAYSKISSNNDKGTNLKETFIDALIWLIEINAYLPFSRTGTITIKGDRRIKIGQWIYFEKSNEVFYVEGVQNNASISGNNLDRKTILKVSRGLVKDYISPKREINKITEDDNTQKGVKIESVSFSNMSYGDLVDIDYLKEGLKKLFVNFDKEFNKKRLKFSKEQDKFIANDSIVVSEVFNFFLSGRQFEGVIKPYIKNYSDKSAISLEEINQIQEQENETLDTTRNPSQNKDRNDDLEINLAQEQNPMAGKRFKRVGNLETGYRFIEEIYN